MKTDLTLKRMMLLFSLVGLADALYLTWIKLANQESACLPGLGNCEVVNTSRYSEILGIPIALFGAVSYALIFTLVILEDQRQPINGLTKYTWKIAVFGISLFGTIYSAFLTYVEIAVIRAICPFCVVSAFVMLVIFILSILRLQTHQDKTIS